jgi:hypothetical protein
MEGYIEAEGYIYCVACNGMYKVGHTFDVNFIINITKAYNLGIAYGFTNSKILFSKRVLHPKLKDEQIIDILETYYYNKDGFYDIDVEEIKKLFDLVDGYYFKYVEKEN